MAVWKHGQTEITRIFGKPRGADEGFEKRHFDIAYSMQSRIREAILHVLSHLPKSGGMNNLALAGGVFLNCDINQAIVLSRSFDQVFVPPFTSDSGGALGAALYSAYGVHREQIPDAELFSPYLGPEYDSASIEVTLKKYALCATEADPCAEVAELLANHKVVGWFQGGMESGPRALGNRSILANPTSVDIRDHLNLKVKLREPYRPFAPVVTECEALRCFEISAPLPEITKYMLMTLKVREEYRSALPGITHVDGTARIQVVTPKSNPLLHRLLVEFGKHSGFQVLINTSFNRQEPVVCAPEDAVNCFQNSAIDVLCLGNYVVRKS